MRIGCSKKNPINYSQERIKQDMLDWSGFKELLKNQGTVVQCKNLRGGRRAIKLDGTTPLNCKKTSRDRKDILKATPIHEDSQSGLDFILKFGQDEYDKLNKEVDEENDILQKLRDLNADINDEYNDDDDDDDDDEEEEEDIDLLELDGIFLYFLYLITMIV